MLSCKYETETLDEAISCCPEIIDHRSAAGCLSVPGYAVDAAAEKGLLLPKTPSRGRGVNDYNDPNSEFCHHRSVQGANVAIFWSKEYGVDPMKVADPNKTFDVNGMLSECERYYKTYVDDLKLVVKGKSISDKYKLVVLVIGGPGGTAFGGGDGDIGTLSTPATRVHKTPYGVLAHEMVHCFHYLSGRDGCAGGRHQS